MAGSNLSSGAPQGSFPVQSRILRGYGPLAVLAVLLVLMAVFIPTRPPQQETVNASSNGFAGSGFGSGTDSGTGTSTDAATTSGTSGSTTGNTGTTGSNTPTTAASASTGGNGGQNGGGGSVGDSGKGNGVAPVTGVQPCADRQEQVPGDPYSPPCVTFQGDNGGATYRGVTGDSIKATYRIIPGEKGFQQTLADLAGASLSDTPETVKNTVTALAEYFSKRFEFYGRSLQFQFYDGTGSNTNELLGKGRDKAEADAETVKELAPFADMSATSEPYADALARRGIIGFGTPYLSRQWHEQRAPFAWSLATDGTRVSELAAEYANKRLYGKPAVLRRRRPQGQDPQVRHHSRPRTPGTRSRSTTPRRITQEAGNDPGLNVKYQLDLSTMSNQANNIIPKLKNEGITTVICGCDPMLPVFLSGEANREQYYPEFIIVGTALTDADIVGQLWDQNFASHAFGVSSLEPFVPPTQTIAYEAFKSVRPNDEPAFSVDLIYYQMYMMAIGIQGAGPDLNPGNLRGRHVQLPATQRPGRLVEVRPR